MAVMSNMVEGIAIKFRLLYRKKNQKITSRYTKIGKLALTFLVFFWFFWGEHPPPPPHKSRPSDLYHDVAKIIAKYYIL